MELKQNERLDEVNDKLRLIQKTDGLTFGTDAYLLSAYLKTRVGKVGVELGCGIRRGHRYYFHAFAKQG